MGRGEGGGGKGRGLPYPSAGTEYAAVPGMFAIASELPPTPGDVHCPSWYLNLGQKKTTNHHPHACGRDDVTRG